MKFYYKDPTEEELKSREVWETAFAWFPVRIGDEREGHYIWLEKYLRKPRFSRGGCLCSYGEIHGYDVKDFEEKRR